MTLTRQAQKETLRRARLTRAQIAIPVVSSQQRKRDGQGLRGDPARDVQLRRARRGLRGGAQGASTARSTASCSTCAATAAAWWRRRGSSRARSSTRARSSPRAGARCPSASTARPASRSRPTRRWSCSSTRAPRRRRRSSRARCRTASARELVGTATFGKGVFQEIVELAEGGALDITVGQYFLPSGRNIGGKGTARGAGLKPDVRAQDDPDTPREDEALDRALAELGSAARP